jgi:hypothetical protein
MMPKLWTFGDSFTEGFNYQYWCKEYIDWKGYVPKVYGEILSEKLDMQLCNFGKCSWDNHSIFESFCRVVMEIEKNDLIIFGWTNPIRFRLTNSGGDWQYFVPSAISDTINAEYMDKDSIQKLILNRGNSKYSEEINIWIKLINHILKDISVIHWTPFDNNINAICLNGFETIRNETNAVLKDVHFSEKGQQQLSNALLTLYNSIKKKDII